MSDRSFIDMRWSVILPFARNEEDVNSIQVDCDNCVYRFTNRRKDLEFAARPREFVFEDREIELYE